jgi:ATP-dependent DNA helicase RecQ
VAAAVRRDGPLPVAELAGRLELPGTRLGRLLNLLDEASAVRLAGDGTVEWAGGSAAAAVRAAGEAADRRRRVDRSRVEMMRQYAETTDCRRRFLLGYFGEELPEPCGSCDNCEAGRAEAAPRQAPGYPLQDRVRHREWGPGVVVASAPDRITVLFDQVGYKTLSLAAVTDQHLLAPPPACP